jgi:glycosyltransferase involved in cell wall biosynthesis
MAPNKTKVLFFCPGDYYGPPMIVLKQIIRHLDRERFDVYMLLNQRATSDVDISALDAHIRYEDFGYTSATRPVIDTIGSAGRLTASMARSIRYLRREGINIVHCTEGPRETTLGLILAKLGGAQLLVHFHLAPCEFKPLKKRVVSFMSHSADAAVGVSQFVAKEVTALGVDAKRVVAVGNGVDVNRFSPEIDGSGIRREYGIPPEAPLVVQLGRIHKRKRPEDLVQAYILARQRVPNLRCLLIGWEAPSADGKTPSYSAQLLEMCKDAGVGDGLIIAPARPDSPQIMAAADIVVLASLNEPWGLVVSEAMAAGKPVVGTTSGAIPEQIVDNETGFLVPPSSPEALAEKIVVLARDPEMRKRFGQAGRLRAETQLSEARLGTEFGNIYQMMMSKRKRNRTTVGSPLAQAQEP